MARAKSAVHIQMTPRGLSHKQSAAYVGVGTSLFDEMVGDGRMPKPKKANTRTIWDRHDLDDAFENLPTGVEINQWDEALGEGE